MGSPQRALKDAIKDPMGSPDETERQQSPIDAHAESATEAVVPVPRAGTLTGLQRVSPSEDPLSHAVTTGVIVLTRNVGLLRVVIDAAADGLDVHWAHDIKHAMQMYKASRGGVLVIDVSTVRDIEKFATRVKHQAPQLLTIAVGQREDGDTLLDLFTHGRIHRFLLEPLSPGQTRRYLATAIQDYIDSRLSSGRAIPLLRRKWQRPALVAAIGTIVVGGVLVALSAMSVLRPGQEGMALTAFTTASIAGSEADAGTGTGQIIDVAPILERAHEAFGAERYLDPVDDSALLHYRAVLEIDPDHPGALSRLDMLAGIMLTRAEAALVDERLADAVVAVELARDIDPGHPRLAFFEGQVAKERERAVLVRAREAVGAADVESLLQMLEQPAEIGADLSEAGQGVLLGLVMESAHTAILEGHTAEASAIVRRTQAAAPADDRLLLATRQLRSEHQRLLTAAVESARREDFEQAQLEIAGAAAISQGDPEALADARGEVTRLQQGALARKQNQEDAFRQRVDAMESSLALASSRLVDGRLIAPPEDNALFYFRRAESIEPKHPAVEETRQQVIASFSEQIEIHLDSRDFEATEELLDRAESVGMDATSVSETRRMINAGRAEAESNRVIPVSELEIVEYVAPQYPGLAVRRKIEGWIDVEFTVTRTGETTDIRITDAAKRGYFEEAAVDAVSRWRFQPRVVGGRTIQQRVRARLEFEYDK